MFRIILILMILGIAGVASPALSLAGSQVGQPPAKVSVQSAVTIREATSQSAVTPDNTGYRIGPGDVLDISVWKDEALTRSCVVRPDGGISFPLIGDVKAGEKTVAQLKEEMEKKLERYVPGGILSLEVKQVNSLIIYVIGKVNTPGRFVMNTNVDVLQALATAGGLNIYAKRGRIKILRKAEREPAIFPFDYDEVVDGKRLDQNIRLKRGDVVVVP